MLDTSYNSTTHTASDVNSGNISMTTAFTSPMTTVVPPLNSTNTTSYGDGSYTNMSSGTGSNGAAALRQLCRITFQDTSGSFDGASFCGGMLVAMIGVMIGYIAINSFRQNVGQKSEYNHMP